MASLAPVNKIKSLMTGLAAAMRRSSVADSFANTLTGVGTGRDKTSYGTWVDDPIMSDEELEALYANNDLAATIVDKIVEDSLRDGFSIKRAEHTPEDDADLTRRILGRFMELQGKEQRFMRGACWGRLFGGGGLLLGVRGAGGLASRLDDSKVTRVEFMKDVDKKQLRAHTWYPDGTVKTYLYQPVLMGYSAENAMPVEVHETRLVLFPGARTTASKRQENQGWDLSVLQRVRKALMSFDGMWASTDAMFQDASQAVFKMQGLISSLAEDTGKEDVRTRLQVMDMIRSAARAIILDAGDEQGNGAESYDVVDRASLGGLDGVIQQYMVRLATAARMPLTVLLGMSPSGMDATGESDMILYYNTVDTYRKQVIQERLLRIIRMLAQEDARSAKVELDAALPRTEFEPEDEDEESFEWSIVWPELSRPKPLDVATAENMRITSAMAMVTAQAWTPEEVALNMDIIAPTMGVRVDLEPRRKALKAAHEEIANREVGLAKMEAESELSTNSAVTIEKSKPKAGAPAAKQSERKTPSKAAKRQV